MGVVYHVVYGVLGGEVGVRYGSVGGWKDGRPVCCPSVRSCLYWSCLTMEMIYSGRGLSRRLLGGSGGGSWVCLGVAWNDPYAMRCRDAFRFISFIRLLIPVG